MAKDYAVKIALYKLALAFEEHGWPANLAPCRTCGIPVPTDSHPILLCEACDIAIEAAFQMGRSEA